MSFKNDVFAQTRTSHGTIPTSTAEALANGKPCTPNKADSIQFVPLSPTEAAHTKDKTAYLEKTRNNKQAIDAQLKGQAEMRSKRSDMPLLQLAISLALVRSQQPDGSVLLQNAISSNELLAFANKYGPLVGRAPFAQASMGSTLSADKPFDESFGFWASAGAVANLAVSIQEFVSGSMPFSALVAKLPSITKQQIQNPVTGNSFSIFTVPIPATQDYAAWLNLPAFIRREATQSHINYSFLLSEEDEGEFYVDLIVASFEKEITYLDYQLLSHACHLTSEIDADVYERLDIANDTSADKNMKAAALSENLLASDELIGDEAPIVKEDLSVLRSMVRALVAAHMRDARVDLFASDEETGYLAFDSLLSWLWYDFSCSLDIARIRYCARCGRAFPLVGHRGPDKLFCSTACKNDARNDRNGQRRNKVRELFREQNKSVAELAHEFFAEESQREGERRVREYLSSWPTLKHDIDDDISQYGWQESPLLKRCLTEKLDPKRFLSTRRQAELKAHKAL